MSYQTISYDTIVYGSCTRTPAGGVAYLLLFTVLYCLFIVVLICCAFVDVCVIALLRSAQVRAFDDRA